MKVYVISKHEENQILGIYTSKDLAERVRIDFARRSIPEFKEILNIFLLYWRNYHLVEFPNYPQPTDDNLLDQFLSEDCGLILDEYQLNKNPSLISYL